MRKKPNVIFVITDDQGYGDLGCTGNPWIKTPQIDEFSQSAFSLENFHVAPLCTPTRGAIMSGRFPLRNGAWATTWGRSFLGRDEVTMADHFKRGGYRTGIFGKWHLGDNYPYRPQDRGFDHVVIHRGGGVGQTPDFWGNNYFNDTYFHNGEPVAHEGYCTDIWFDEAIKYMDRCGSEPFFCYIATNAPHAPYLVADKYADPYRSNESIVEPEFYGMISNIDENFGKLRDYLKQKDLEENTILIFMTDNGSSGCGILDNREFLTKGFNGGLRGKKGSYYEGGHRVPFFIHWPAGKIEKDRSGELCGHVDLIPTLLELCQIDFPSEIKRDGISLAGLLEKRESTLSERPLFFQYRQNPEPPVKWESSLAVGPWRLIRGKELYNIESDREQRKDLASEKKDLVRDLREHYDSYWAQVEKDLSRVHPIVIGSDKQNPLRLDSFDLMGDAAWSQSQVKEALKVCGQWNLEVEQSGTYQFKLCRWPKELDKELNRGIENTPGSALSIVRASIKIQGEEIFRDIKSNENSVCFDITLKKGQTPLEARFYDETGESWSAYYVYLERM
jgi:arylsulfatase A-like enzyme